MIRIIISLALLIAFNGCASSSSKMIPGPNGTPAFFIKCGSAVLDACYEEAAKVCPKGYTMIDREESPKIDRGESPNSMIAPVGRSEMTSSYGEEHGRNRRMGGPRNKKKSQANDPDNEQDQKRPNTMFIECKA